MYYSLKKMGISTKRITYKGMGSSMLLGDVDPRSPKQRRVTFEIVESEDIIDEPEDIKNESEVIEKEPEVIKKESKFKTNCIISYIPKEISHERKKYES